ncbi:MAG: peptidylprolyl isomerase [Alphaproteobacteria bacterium]|nr:peptidylprolyl isomerase [Alphaproteobacteria bacterium]
MRSVCLRFVLLFCGLAACSVAQAQQAGRIVAVVNDDIITRYDVIARLGIALSSSNVRDTPEIRRRLGSQILRTLMDERLQSQEAGRLGVRVSEREVQRQIEDIEKRNNLPPGGLVQFFRNNRLDIEALKEHLRVEAAWSTVVARRIAPRIEVGAGEIDARLAERRAAVGSKEYVVSEIFLELDDPAREGEVRGAVEGIVAQLRAGASFEGLARQFSQSSSAAIGGDLGRVRAGQLDTRLEAALDALSPNGVSAPVRLEDGFYILQLRERSVVESAAADDASERAGIERRLRVERISRRADRYLQDLRRSALIFRRR